MHILSLVSLIILWILLASDLTKSILRIRYFEMLPLRTHCSLKQSTFVYRINILSEDPWLKKNAARMGRKMDRASPRSTSTTIYYSSGDQANMWAGHLMNSQSVNAPEERYAFSSHFACNSDWRLHTPCRTAKLFSLVLPTLTPSFPEQLPYFLEFHSCACSRLKLASGSQALYVSLPTPGNEVFQQALIITRKCSCSSSHLLRSNLKTVLDSSIHSNSFISQDKDGLFPNFFKIR